MARRAPRTLAARVTASVRKYTKALAKYRAKKLNKKVVQRALKAARKTVKRAAKSMPVQRLKRVVLAAAKAARGPAPRGGARKPAAPKAAKQTTPKPAATKAGPYSGKAAPPAVAPRGRQAGAIKNFRGAVQRGPRGGQFVLGPGGAKEYV